MRYLYYNFMLLWVHKIILPPILFNPCHHHFREDLFQNKFIDLRIPLPVNVHITTITTK